MINVEVTDVVEANPEKVFNLVFDYERYPDFMPGVKSVNIIERDKHSLKIEMSAKIAGSNLRWQSVADWKEYEYINWKMVKGQWKEMNGKWMFSSPENGNKTKVISTMNFITGYPLILGFANMIAKKEVQENLQLQLEAIKKELKK